MTLSRWARNVLEQMRWFWRKLGDCFPKQSWIAAKLKISSETVCRAVRELKQAGLVKVHLHGPRGATYEEIIPDPPSAQMNLCFDGDLDDDCQPASLVTECVSEVPSGKPSPVPIRTESLPERIIGILNRAWGRIKRAKNPAAYREAIIQSELRLMRTNKLLPIKEVPYKPNMGRPTFTDRIPTWPPPEDDEITASELEQVAEALKEFEGRKRAS